MRPGGLLFRVYNKTQQRLADNSALVLHLTDALTHLVNMLFSDAL